MERQLIQIDLTDHSEYIREELQAACIVALEKCGLVAEGYAKQMCPVDTGLLRNSIAHALGGEIPKIGGEKSKYESDRPDASGEKKKGEYTQATPEDSSGEITVYIGTNVEYSAYQELGSGKHYDGGRKTRWTYKDAKGKQHLTGGNTAKPFLKPAIADHVPQYERIFRNELEG